MQLSVKMPTGTWAGLAFWCLQGCPLVLTLAVLLCLDLTAPRYHVGHYAMGGEKAVEVQQAVFLPPPPPAPPGEPRLHGGMILMDGACSLCRRLTQCGREGRQPSPCSHTWDVHPLVRMWVLLLPCCPRLLGGNLGLG